MQGAKEMIGDVCSFRILHRSPIVLPVKRLRLATSLVYFAF